MDDVMDDRSNRRIAKIEDSLDVGRAGAVQVAAGGVQFASMMEVMDFAKLMALSEHAVPGHLRGNPGACLAIVVQALEWRMSPFAVANKSYIARDGQPMAYESQLVHAVIEARAPLRERLRARYEGEGDNLKCFVYGTFRGESEPRVWPPEGKSNEYTLARLRPPMGDKGRKGSPLWDKKPELQMFYNVSRDWARVHCPDVLLGIYSPEEFDETPINQADMQDVTPKLMERLSGRMEGPGFSPTVVDEGLNGRPADEDAKPRRRRKPKDTPPAAEVVREPDPPTSDPEPPVEQEGASEQVAADPAPEVDPLGDFIDIEAFDGERWLASVKHSLGTATDEAGMLAIREDQFRPHQTAARSLDDGTWDAAVSAYGKRLRELGLSAPATTKPAKPATAAPQNAASEAGLFQPPKAAAPAHAAQRGSKAQEGTKDHPGFHADGMMRCPAWAQQYPAWVKWWSGRITVADWQVKMEEQWLDEADLRRELQMSPRETKAARALVDDEIAKRKDAARKK